ncbi:MAG: adenosine deaminase [Mycobacteriales bacterium]
MHDVELLPKAHLHLHLTGGMRPATLVELAAEQGKRLPDGLLRPGGLEGVARRGWMRFQRLYDAARDVLRGPEDVHRVIREIALDNLAAGAGWVEVQVDPSSYAAKLGGLTAAVEVVLDGMRVASEQTGVGMALVVAANRTRHPGDAETLARVARRFAGQGVVGFGLSNDETRGDTAAFAKAFRLARDAGLIAVPHAGEMRGAGSVRLALDHLGPTRLGHGVRSVEDPAVVDELVRRRVALEICPASNVALGVAASLGAVPVQRLREAGLEIALGADDPLVFRSGLVDQYAALSALGPAFLADLAASSIRSSCAPSDLTARLLAGVAVWQAGSL